MNPTQQQQQHSVKFVRSGRGPAKCPSDPAYPKGIDLNLALKGELTCTVKLPYPAQECGYFMVECSACKRTIAITAAGRPDDPRSVIIPCKETKPQ